MQIWILKPEAASLSFELVMAVFINSIPSSIEIFGFQSASKTPNEKGEPEPNDINLSSSYKVPNKSIPYNLRNK